MQLVTDLMQAAGWSCIDRLGGQWGPSAYGSHSITVNVPQMVANGAGFEQRRGGPLDNVDRNADRTPRGFFLAIPPFLNSTLWPVLVEHQTLDCVPLKGVGMPSSPN
ncbi:hypothetical protein N7462_005356 [Penicillium macrosclerotiorum]|uniref:uncharacterized protein n=1 Tax=Penicillium macrosclerotiorum TaxID=303699 RepID=UPI00254818DD|nr:uncharacterized protein N7462_005356 [Penicillium macrosclerotiorum]KAJ5682191.1 hypothetical protein N7462_005356 [Penicillium macrosclerotiorum]